jgi:hypothetical protein
LGTKTWPGGAGVGAGLELAAAGAASGDFAAPALPAATVLSGRGGRGGWRPGATSLCLPLSFLFLFASMTPLGSWLSLNSPEVMVYKDELNAISIGIFLHVSTTILFESSKDHKFNLAKLSTIIAAIVIAYFI